MSGHTDTSAYTLHQHAPRHLAAKCCRRERPANAADGAILALDLRLTHAPAACMPDDTAGKNGKEHSDGFVVCR